MSQRPYEVRYLISIFLKLALARSSSFEQLFIYSLRTFWENVKVIESHIAFFECHIAVSVDDLRRLKWHEVEPFCDFLF